MPNFIIHKSSLKGEITIPPSKSHTLRALLFASLARGKSIISNYLASNDMISMANACRNFGAQLDIFSHQIEIEGIKGTIPFTKDIIDAGNSGIVLRFCSAVGALSSRPVVVTGDSSIKTQRPMKALLEGLLQLGVKASSMRGDGYAPVLIKGPLISGKAFLNGEDSQPISALLIAAAFCPGQVELHVQNPGEKAWVEVTLNWLTRLGIPYENRNFEYFCLGGSGVCGGFQYEVPGDFSSAAFPIAAALVTGSELFVKGLDFSDCQGDKSLITIFQRMGAEIEIAKSHLHVKTTRNLKGISIDLNDCIDAITILAVVACYSEGETHIYNASIARHKECNRIASITRELKLMGGVIEETEDGLLIKGSPLKGAYVNSYGDHRMAMSLAVAGLGAEGETKVESISCVNKTFPTFLHEMRLLGAKIEEVP